MRLTPSDPDVETLVGRIDSQEIDLQPDFQRGEVWSLSKKQRLIDTILRDWHIPPVHVIVDQVSQRSAVLDGQQRLAAIRDFKRNRFVIDGTIPPTNSDIQRLHGLTFDALPREWKARFNQFTIRVFRITDYEPSEPAELFFRLNQPTALTSAEKRNAFFGTTREQVRELVEQMEAKSLAKGFWGFSSARMAYDDIVARACMTLENGSLRKKVTANALADRYRTGEPFDQHVIESLGAAIDALGSANQLLTSNLGFNKATAQTCLIFACQLQRQLPDTDALTMHLAAFLDAFSNLTQFEWLAPGPLGGALQRQFSQQTAESLLRTYNDRATSRVADTSSVVLRDFVMWCTFTAYALDELELPSLKEIRRLTDVKPRMQGLQVEGIEAVVNEIAWDLQK